MNQPTTTLVAACLLLALCAPAPAPAQASPDGSRFGAGLRLGAFDMVNSPDSYDAVYGDAMPMVGVQAEWWLRPRFVLGAALDYGQVDGERVLPSDPPRGTGIGSTLTYVPLHLTAAWRADRGGDWAFLLGGGPSLLSWEDDGGVGKADGTDVGAHVTASLRRQLDRWSFGGDLRWSTFPDAVGDAGVTKLYGEDDLGGLSLHLVALRRF